MKNKLTNSRTWKKKENTNKMLRRQIMRDTRGLINA